MADLDDLTAFAAARRHNLTKPLAHEQVVALAEAWFPELRFHELERFHPVDVTAMLTAPPPIFDGLPPAEQQERRIGIVTSVDADGNPVEERFDPPVVFAGSGRIQRVLGEGAGAAAGMADLEGLGDSGVFTYGPNLTAARTFFGASTTVAGDEDPEPGDPRVPRHLPMVVHAELRMLLETLKHELELDDLPGALSDHGLPIDAIWSGFAVEDSFFQPEEGPDRPPRFTRPAKRSILADLIAAYEAGDSAAERAARDRTPDGWRFVDKTWDLVKRFAFLEYYLFYAFNDYREYGTAPFENEHEGDDEGCCVVFERRLLEDFAAGEIAAADVRPHSLITAAHEPFQGLDDIKRLPEVAARARDDLIVYVAAGSHGNYLTAGAHDLLDWEDIATDLPLQLPVVILLLTSPDILAMGVLLVGLIEHIVDAEDHTSDNGASIGPGEPDVPNLKFDKLVAVTPLSDFVDSINIYQDTPAQRVRLPIRGFRGKWGADAGLVDKSPNWRNKTARFFQTFLGSDNIEPPPPVVD